MPQTIKILASEANQRLDTFLVNNLDGYNRSQITKLIKTGLIKINGFEVKPGHKIKINDTVIIDFKKNSVNDVGDAEILYEDENIIVLDKPSGMLTHSKGDTNNEKTVATVIQDKISGISGNRAGIVHRLDRATSGVIVTAKNESTLKMLQKQFANRKVIKKYIAIVSGQLNEPAAVIDMPIQRDPSNPKTFRVDSYGKSSQTEYKTVRTTINTSMLEITPKTGRTHQIRVHLAHLGHPIVGDIFYNGRPYKRLLLHAKSIEITIPNEGRKIFVSKTPSEFNDIME